MVASVIVAAAAAAAATAAATVTAAAMLVAAVADLQRKDGTGIKGVGGHPPLAADIG